MAKSISDRTKSNQALNAMHKETIEALAELDAFIVIEIVDICKAEVERSGANSGQMECPRCSSGTLRWVQASNGHIHVQCDRTITPPGIESFHCVNAME